MLAVNIFYCFYFVQFTFAFRSNALRSIWGLPEYRNGFQRVCLCRCGVSRGQAEGARNGRILRGQAVAPHEYPWLAAINIGNQVLAGSLVSDRHVITAASPLYGLTPDRISVTLGAHDRCYVAGPGMNVTVEAITLHPGYSTDTKQNDIALVKLRHVVAFSQYISPICLPNFGMWDNEQMTTTAGWANTTDTCVPQVAMLPTLTAASCSKGLGDSKFLTPDKGCLGPTGIKSVICKNDVGAPVMHRWSSVSPLRLVGVVSTSSCDVTTPPLYTRVIDYTSWISEHIRYDCQCF